MFTVEEKCIIKGYLDDINKKQQFAIKTEEHAIEILSIIKGTPIDIKKSRPLKITKADLSTEIQNTIELLQSCIDKLTYLSDGDFDKLDLSDVNNQDSADIIRRHKQKCNSY